MSVNKKKTTEETIVKKSSVKAAVSSWIGEDEKEKGNAEQSFPIENRPSRLGIGAKFLAHKDAVTTSAAETGLKRIINRDQEEKKRKYSEIVPKKDDEDENDGKKISQ